MRLNALCTVFITWKNEIKMMLSSVENNVDTLILFGIGNGYALEHIINKYKNLYEIVVIEPSLEIFKEYLKNWDLAKMLKVKKNLSISFLVNKSERLYSRNIVF